VEARAAGRSLAIPGASDAAAVRAAQADSAGSAPASEALVFPFPAPPRESPA